VYAITWFPVLIIYMLNYYHVEQEYGNVTYIIGIVIVTFNSCVNPFVYAFVNERFRSHLKSLLELPCLKINRVQLQSQRRQAHMAATESSNSQQPRQAFELRE